ncbi:hypothetical protein D477_003043 [Arthrobacter crystallopoietes BAB-32]|uniref:Uncharacterized protein n=1 Tax=Arthrobacter crystallopoietes BAB-32 TaxID=1246476 RepID=N1V6A6_9MICC|nr:DUF5956 family protein [Arthrobacter crystallopoietes]EMY35637.1 hypothetical protein D477_003043 [Arthrobacter crystallopoietes BAB-32]
MSPTDWDAVADGQDGDGWVEIPETGWAMLAAWAAGTENVRRRPVDDTGRQVRITTESDGVSETRYAPFTAEDRRAVDEGIQDYLRDAGVQLPPRGFVWLMRLPPGIGSEEELARRINAGISGSAPGAVHPADIALAMEQVIDVLYERD